MKTHELAATLSSTLEKPVATILDRVSTLQAGLLFSKGTRGRSGGLDLTETDVTNLLLACELRPARGADVCDLVRKVRGMFHDQPPVIWPSNLTKSLTCFSRVTAGEMLDAVLADLRKGTFDRWSAGQAFRLNAGIFHNGASVFISLDRGDDERAIAGYAKRGWMSERSSVERQTTLDHRWFKHLAERLGPLPAR
jgi:hypothetical protein